MFSNLSVRSKAVKIVAVLLIAMVLLTTTACSAFQVLMNSFGAVFGLVYAPSSTACDAIIRGAATFESLSLDDQWGLVWQGMFGIFSEDTSSTSVPDVTLRALSALGYKIELYETTEIEPDEYNDYRGYDINYYRIVDSSSLTVLAQTALSLLQKQTDAATVIKWAEDLYNELVGLTDVKSYTLAPYASDVAAFASQLFSAGGDFGAQCAALYVEEYPAGAFIDAAQARVQAEAGTDATFVG